MQQRKSTYTLLTIFTVLFAILFPHFGLIPLPFGYVLPVLLLIWGVLKYSNETFASIGFSFGRFEWKAVWLGAVGAVLLFVFLKYVFAPLLNSIIKIPAANLEDFAFIKGNLAGLLLVSSMGWLVGGFYEELVFHGYIFTRIEKAVHAKWATAIAFVVSNLIFALYHFQLGVEGVLVAFIAGCCYHGLMLKFDRNVWYAFFFHGFYDSIALTDIYLGN